MDGVLVNTEDIAHDIFEKFALEYNSEFTEHDHKHILGSTESYWAKYLCEKWNVPISNEEFANIYWKRRNIVLDSKLKLLSGVKQLFDLLKNTGFKIALVTSTPRDYVNIILERFDLMNYFDVSVTGDEIINGKPFPEPYIKAIESLGLQPEECVVVEDSIGGVTSGKTAGCFVVAIPTIHAKGLDYSSADLVFESLNELILS